MSKPKYHELTNILTYPSYVDELTDDQCLKLAQKDINALCKWFDLQAKKNGWEYSLYVVASMKDLDTLEKNHLHIHLVLTMSPGWTGINIIRDYWSGKSCDKQDRRKGRKNGGQPCGIVRAAKECFDLDGMLEYMRKQSITGRIRKQSNLNHSHAN